MPNKNTYKISHGVFENFYTILKKEPNNEQVQKLLRLFTTKATPKKNQKQIKVTIF